METHTTVLYHGNCPDGFGAALACWQQWGDEAVYIPVSYGQALPTIPGHHHVMIVDFSYPPETVLDIRQEHVAQGASVTLLDHHASAQRDLTSLAGQRLPGLHIVFDLEESGATLAWKWFTTRGHLPDPNQQPDVWAAVEAAMPRLYAYLRDRDLWRWALPHSKEISLALWCVERTFAQWIGVAHDLDEETAAQRMIERGAAIRCYSERLVEEQACHGVIGVIGGYTVPIVNATTLFSEVGDYLCTTQKDIWFCAYYFDRNDGKRQWGLRGHGKVDLSHVAKEYAGGGHPNAAGFITERGWMPPVM